MKCLQGLIACQMMEAPLHVVSDVSGAVAGPKVPKGDRGCAAPVGCWVWNSLCQERTPRGVLVTEPTALAGRLNGRSLKSPKPTLTSLGHSVHARSEQGLLGHAYTSWRTCYEKTGDGHGPWANVQLSLMWMVLESLVPSARCGLASAWPRGSSLCLVAATTMSSMRQLLAILPLRRASTRLLSEWGPAITSPVA